MKTTNHFKEMCELHRKLDNVRFTLIAATHSLQIVAEEDIGEDRAFIVLPASATVQAAIETLSDIQDELYQRHLKNPEPQQIKPKSPLSDRQFTKEIGIKTGESENP